MSFDSKLISLSTAHLAPEDGRLLLGAYERKRQGIAPYGEGVGHFVFIRQGWAGDEPWNEIDDYGAFSVFFRKLLYQLQAREYDFVRFDADAEVHPDFPTYEW